MEKTTRRAILHTAWAAPSILAAHTSTDVRIVDIQPTFEEFFYRTPYMFGGRKVDRVTMLNVTCEVESRGGKRAKGFAAMSLGNQWAFPSQKMNYDETLGAMTRLARRIGEISRANQDYGHPVDLNHTLEPQWLAAAAEVSQKDPEPIPKLCTLVVGSPFDAAISDAYGKLHNRSSYAIYGRDLMRYDLGHYLGEKFKGETLQRYIGAKPRPFVYLFHSVGASDPLTVAEVKTPLQDGLPNAFEEWIGFSGLERVKIKLNGGDASADLARILAIDRITTQVQAKRRLKQWYYCLDFNERCPNVQYLMEILRKVKEATPAGFERIQYVEQPTQRNLRADRDNVMHEAAKLRPVVIDESLTDLETLLLSREMGYTGIALKACKGQTQAMLMAAAGQKFGMFLCVQDLTCPGAALVHSVGIAGHVPGVAGVEANARQYVPSASKAWESKYPGLFQVRNGRLNSGQLTGPGLSIRV
jgi:L-alanine-DL-glutamate epimerase-like enolase superfamily enzyme